MLFALVGMVGTACHFAVLALTVGGLGFDSVLGSSLGALTGALVNYWLNHRYHYRSARRHREALTRFLVVATAGFALNAVCMALLTVKLGLHYLLAQVFTTGIVLVWNFTANHFWTFQRLDD